MTILLGWVPRPEGEAALERALMEAELRDEDLVVINTSSGTAYADPNYATEEQLQAAQQRLANSGVTYDLRHAVHGDEPAIEILKEAEEAAATLIVIGLRHRTAVGKFLMGSTAQRILMGARCPVLAVPAPDTRIPA